MSITSLVFVQHDYLLYHNIMLYKSSLGCAERPGKKHLDMEKQKACDSYAIEPSIIYRKQEVYEPCDSC